MSDPRSSRRGHRRILVSGLVLLIGLAGVLAWLVRSSRFAGPPLPSPNGYDTLLAAARLVRGIPPARGVAAKATDEELRAFVAMNDAALAAARPGFAQESVVPLVEMASIEAHVDQMGPPRDLSRVLVCRAVLARREGRTADAVQTNLDLLRLAHAVAHGGLLPDQSLSMALRRQALSELDGPLLPTLSAGDARRVIADLERLGRDREPVRRIANRDLDFALSRQGVMIRLAYMVNRKAMDSQRATAIQAVEAAEAESRRRTRSLLVQLALHAYALDHPEAPRPGDLGALVPSYLAEVPRTPGGERRLTLDDFKPQPATTADRGRE